MGRSQPCKELLDNRLVRAQRLRAVRWRGAEEVREEPFEVFAGERIEIFTGVPGDKREDAKDAKQADDAAHVHAQARIPVSENERLIALTHRFLPNRTLRVRILSGVLVDINTLFASHSTSHLLRTL